MGRSRGMRVASGGLAAVLVLLAGCSGESGTDALSADNEPALGTADGSGDASGAEEHADRAGAKEAVDTASLPQHVIRSARVEIEDDDLTGVRREVDALLGRVGGHIAEEETANDEDGRPGHSLLVLRVPARAFDQVLTAFPEFTTVISTTRDGKDVATEVVDLDARIRAQEVSLRRLRGFLGQAENVDALVRLESEVTRREAELQSLRARATHLADQVALSTVTVRMVSPGAPVVKAGALDDAGFFAGLTAGWRALAAVGVVAVTALGAALPFLALLATLSLPLIAVRRRRRPHPTAGPVAPAD